MGGAFKPEFGLSELGKNLGRTGTKNLGTDATFAGFLTTASGHCVRTRTRSSAVPLSEFSTAKILFPVTSNLDPRHQKRRMKACANCTAKSSGKSSEFRFWKNGQHRRAKSLFRKILSSKSFFDNILRSRVDIGIAQLAWNQYFTESDQEKISPDPDIPIF
jgi:hypothetical protein